MGELQPQFWAHHDFSTAKTIKSEVNETLNAYSSSKKLPQTTPKGFGSGVEIEHKCHGRYIKRTIRFMRIFKNTMVSKKISSLQTEEA